MTCMPCMLNEDCKRPRRHTCLALTFWTMILQTHLQNVLVQQLLNHMQSVRHPGKIQESGAHAHSSHAWYSMPQCGCACRDINEGTYYPAASLYTLPEQSEGATVTFNFGAQPLHWC